MKTDIAETQENWIEIFPYGVAFGGDRTRPLVLFKDEGGERVVPVWSNALDAGIALFQNQFSSGAASPHSLTWKILKPLGVRLEAAYFTAVKGHHQYLELNFTGHPELTKVQQRADEALSFCLSAETRFFCKPEFIEESRQMEAHLMDQGQRRVGANRSGTYKYLN